MRLLSVNAGRGRAIPRPRKPAKTGIHKRPVSGTVRVTAEGVEGDEILDTKNHGGVDQAVYLYGAPDYEWWEEALERELPPGIFGENLTISDLRSADARIGDRLRIGRVILEVTAPRIPCVTLATRMEAPTFVKRFREAERPGLYCRVIHEGSLRAGDAVEYERHLGEALSAIEMFRDFFDPDSSERTIRRHLAAPVAVRARVAKEGQLRELLAGKVVVGDG